MAALMALGTRAKRPAVGPEVAHRGRNRCVPLPSVLDTRATDCMAAAARTVAGVEDYTVAAVGTSAAVAVAVDTVAAQGQHH